MHQIAKNASKDELLSLAAESRFAHGSVAGEIVVFRYTDVKLLLESSNLWNRRPADSRLSSLSLHDRALYEDLSGFFTLWPAFSEGINHKRSRSISEEALNSVNMKLFRQNIMEKCTRLLDSLWGKEFDWISEFAAPLARFGLQDVLKIDDTAIKYVTDLGKAILERVGTAEIEMSRVRDCLTGRDYLEQWLFDKSNTMNSDFLSSLHSKAILLGADVPSTTALFAQVVTGSLEPITASLGHLAESFSSGLEGVSPVAFREETFRIATPFGYAPRYVRKEFVLGGLTLTPGQRISPCLLTANHDRQIFSERSQNLSPRTTPHLAFSIGNHRCPGAGIARVIVGSVVRALSESNARFIVSNCEKDSSASILRYQQLKGRLEKVTS